MLSRAGHLVRETGTFRRFGLIAAFACAVPLYPQRAEGQALPEQPAYEKMSLEELLQVPIVVTASRQEEAATEAPATTIVVTREEIRLRGYSFLKDVLRDLPGMETKEYNYILNGGTQVPVRGVVGNNKIIILINGMRVNPPGGEAAPLYSDISVRDADQIEIVYGPGSTLYGQDSISAVINVITRRTTSDNIPRSKTELRERLLYAQPMSLRLLSAGVEFGYPWQKEVWSSLNLHFGKARLYGSVHYIDKQLTDLSSSYPEFWAVQEAQAEGRGLPLEPRRHDTGLNVMFRAEYESTSFQVWHRQSSRVAAEGLGVTSPSGYVPESSWADQSTAAQLRNTLPIGHYLTLESTLSFNRYEVDPSSHSRIATPRVPGRTPIWLNSFYGYGRGLSGSLDERLVFHLAPRITVAAGFFAAHYEVTPISSVGKELDLRESVATQGGSVNYYLAPGDPSSIVSISRINPVSYQDFGAYVEANWRIFRLLRLIVGLRLDKNTIVEDLAFSPRAALIFNYKLFSAKYIFARAFVAPPPTEKFFVYQSATSVHGPNLALQPETAMSNELNLSVNHRRFSLGTSVFYNTQSNLIFQNGLPNNFVQMVWLDPQGMRPANLTQAANGGSSQAVGVDLYGKWTLWKLSGWASYSYVNVSMVAADMPQPPQGFSAHNFRLGVSYSILKNLHATLGAIVKSVPENLMMGTAVDDLINVPWELNAHILYSPIPSLDLYLDFKNLSDNHYYLAGGVGAGNLPYPAQGIQASSGLRFSL